MTNSREKIKLLLVDDELDFLRATSGPLARRGFAVTAAQNGSKALDLIGSEEFDVVVLDVKMPGIDGVDVFGRIKMIAPELPVIMLTGHGTVKQAFETSRDGVFEYLTKPCDIDKLAEVARNAFENRVGKPDRDGKSTEIEESIRLLFVDDELDFLDSLSEALSRRGILVTKAINTTEAMAFLNSQSFDVALVDMKMPGSSGIKLLVQINEREDFIPVIILTGQSSMGNIVRAAKEGAFDILAKPQDVDVITKKIKDAYQYRQVRAEEQRNRKIKGILENNPD